MDGKMLDGAVHLEVDQIGHVGMELLLAAVASGAGGVVVVSGPQDPPTIRKAVEWQAQMAGAILQGLGMPEDKIRFAVVPPENGETPHADFLAVGPRCATRRFPGAVAGIPSRFRQAGAHPPGDRASLRSSRRA